MRIITFTQDEHFIRGIMQSQGGSDFQAPLPTPKHIDTLEALDEIPSHDPFELAPDDF